MVDGTKRTDAGLLNFHGVLVLSVKAFCDIGQMLGFSIHEIPNY